MRGARVVFVLFLSSVLVVAAVRTVDASGGPCAGRDEKDVPFLETVLAYSYPEGRNRDGRPVDAAAVAREIDRLAAHLRPLVADRTDSRRLVSVMNRFLYEKEGFAYDPAPGNVENYLPDRVLARKCGNCLGLTVLSLALAERLGLPLRGAYVPSHCFVRYEDGSARINIETAEKGAEWDDARYARVFGLAGNRPYLVSLGRKEMIGVYLKSLGAGRSRIGREEEALDLYRAASRFAPGLPDVAYNAGVSYQKMGRLDEAIAQYRKALSLDPALPAARDNLGVALASQGFYREALEEAQKAVTLDPRNVSSRGNLAATFCACGMTTEGIREFERILEADPGNARALSGLSRVRRPVSP